MAIFVNDFRIFEFMITKIFHENLKIEKSAISFLENNVVVRRKMNLEDVVANFDHLYHFLSRFRV